jgi:hypothetical protein
VYCDAAQSRYVVCKSRCRYCTARIRVLGLHLQQVSWPQCLGESNANDTGNRIAAPSRSCVLLKISILVPCTVASLTGGTLTHIHTASPLLQAPRLQWYPPPPRCCSQANVAPILTESLVCNNPESLSALLIIPTLTF